MEPKIPIPHHPSSDNKSRKVHPFVARFVHHNLPTFECPEIQGTCFAYQAPNGVVGMVFGEIRPECSSTRGSVDGGIEQVRRGAKRGVIRVEVDNFTERRLNESEAFDLPVLCDEIGQECSL